MVKQTTEEDPDEGIKDLVELALKKMVYIASNYNRYVAKFLFIRLFCLLICFRCIPYSVALRCVSKNAPPTLAVTEMTR